MRLEEEKCRPKDFSPLLTTATPLLLGADADRWTGRWSSAWSNMCQRPQCSGGCVCGLRAAGKQRADFSFHTKRHHVHRSLLPRWIVSELKKHKNRHISRTKTINRPGASMVVGPTMQHTRTTLRMRLLQGAVYVSDLFCSQKGPIQSLYPRRSLG